MGSDPQMIYKYMPQDSLERLIKTKSLSFTRIDKWDDVYEGIMLRVIMSNPLLEAERKRIAAIIPKMVYAQSWTHRAEESDAMWKIFAGKLGVRICAYTNHIHELIKKFLPANFDMIDSGYVAYSVMTPVYDTDAKNVKSALLTKNIAYDYEHEYRFGIYNSTQWSRLKIILSEKDKDQIDILLSELEKEVDSNEGYLNYNLADDTIREMILRYDSSDDDLLNIKQKCRDSGLKMNYLDRSNLHNNGLNF